MRIAWIFFIFTLSVSPIFSSHGLAADEKKNSCPKADPKFLSPYISQLIKESSKEMLAKITVAPESELIMFHFEYGTWIRNKWLRGNREPKLIQYFQCQGISDPDDMSTKLITALWRDLNDKKSVEEKRVIGKKRQEILAKRKEYEKIMRECERKLFVNESKFTDCFKKFGNPASNPLNKDPFYQMKISKNGKVSHIEHFTGGSETVNPCLDSILNAFEFSPFSFDEEIEVYTTTFPSCRTSAIDRLLD